MKSAKFLVELPRFHHFSCCFLLLAAAVARLIMALTHAQAVAGKLEAMRLEFEWRDGTFHVLKDRKSLPKDRRDVHGRNIILTKQAQLVWSCYKVVLMLL